MLTLNQPVTSSIPVRLTSGLALERIRLPVKFFKEVEMDRREEVGREYDRLTAKKRELAPRILNVTS